MTITVELWEDTGAVSSGHGTTRIAVNNVGWKNSGLDETNAYVYYPIRRPPSDPYSWSFTHYNYLKISGTYANGSRPRVEISGSVTGSPPGGYQGVGGSTLKYKLSNTYAVPTATEDATLLTYTSGPLVLYPNMSTTGPEAATGFVKHFATNTTYFSEYLITQLRVDQAGSYGNIGALIIKVFLDEYESTDI